MCMHVIQFSSLSKIGSKVRSQSLIYELCNDHNLAVTRVIFVTSSEDMVALGKSATKTQVLSNIEVSGC